MTIVAEPGDVVLFEPGKGGEGISKFIAEQTSSKYSHAAIAVASDTYVQTGAFADEPDVRKHGADVLTKMANARNTPIDLYRAPHGPLNIEKMLQCVDSLIDEAKKDRVVFSLGAMSGLLVLRRAVVGPPPPFVSEETLKRLQHALVTALDDGHDRMFCTELVYRVSEAGGLVPPVRDDAFIPPDVIPRENEGIIPTAWFERLIRFVAGHFGVPLDQAAAATFREFWERAHRAFDSGELRPDVDRANFIVPGDFEHSDYRKIGTWDPASSTWVDASSTVERGH